MSHFKKMVPMSKGEETVVWMDFVRALPDESYLKPMLVGLDRHLRGCMMNDIVENVAEILEGRDKKMAELQKLLDQAHDLWHEADADRDCLRKVLDRKDETLKTAMESLADAQKTAEGYRADLEREGDRLIEARLQVRALEAEVDKFKLERFEELYKILERVVVK